MFNRTSRWVMRELTLSWRRGPQRPRSEGRSSRPGDAQWLQCFRQKLQSGARSLRSCAKYSCYSSFPTGIGHVRSKSAPVSTERAFAALCTSFAALTSSATISFSVADMPDIARSGDLCRVARKGWEGKLRQPAASGQVVGCGLAASKLDPERYASALALRFRLG